MSTITSTMVIAGAGFIQNQGLTVSPAMLSAFNSFTSSPSNNFSTISQSIISQAQTAGFPMPDLGANNAPWITGVSPAGLSLPVGFNAGNVVGEMTTQANQLLSQGTKGFQQFFGQGHGYGTTSFLYAGAIQLSQGKSFIDVGLNMSKYSDFVSGGVGKAIGDIQSLAKTVTNFGSLLDFKDLTTIANPGKLVQNLLKQGLGNFGGIQQVLADNGITAKDLLDPSKSDQILRVLKTVTGTSLQNIIKATGVSFPDMSKINTLADLLDINKILPQNVLDSLNSGIASLEDLGTQLASVAGSFASVDDLGNFLDSIEVPAFPHLDSLTSLIPNDIIGILTPYVAQGSGVFGNPTITDLFGTAAGFVHTGAFNQSLDSQAQIAGTPQGLTLTAALYNLQNVVNTPGQTAGNVAIARSQVDSALDAIAFNTNPTFANIVNLANTQYNGSVGQLLKEKNNLVIAGVNMATSVTGSISSVLSLATQLHTFGIDSMKLNTSAFFDGLSADNVYGDAIKACLLEGRNVARIVKSGTKVGNFVNPIASLK